MKKITDTNKEKFSGIWNAERVINNYVILYGKKGVDVKDVRIRRNQFASVLRGYLEITGMVGILKFRSSENYESDFYDGYYLDSIMTKDQCKEFIQIMRSDIPKQWKPYRMSIRKIREFLSSPLSRRELFRSLLDYRCRIEDFLYGGPVTLCCTREKTMVEDKMRFLYGKNILEANKTLDKLICLLMGKAFTTEIPEWELIDKYDYPAYTEKEIQYMYMDYDF